MESITVRFEGWYDGAPRPRCAVERPFGPQQRVLRCGLMDGHAGQHRLMASEALEYARAVLASEPGSSARSGSP